jgi:hypothetical protein
LPATVWPYPSPQKCSHEDLQRACWEVANDLWEFLRNALSKQLVFVASLRRQMEAGELDEGLFVTQLTSRFLGYLDDQSRGKDVSPRRYLYRRCREELSAAEEFVYQATDDWGYFGMEEGAPILRHLEEKVPPYANWRSPVSLVAEEKLREKIRKVDVLALARFFWEQAKGHLGKAYLIPIGELVAYLGAHYTLFLDPIHEPIDESHPDQSVGRSTDHLDGLAVEAVASWSRERRQVFALRYGETRKTLQAIASEMGWKSPANVDYHWKQAIEALADFVRDHFDDEPEEDALEFLDRVAGVCKSAPLGP